MNWVPDKFEEKHTWAFSNEYQTISGTMLLNKKTIMEAAFKYNKTFGNEGG